MKTRTVLALLTVVLTAALVPAFASADAGTTVQADLTQLSADVKTLHDTLLPDLAAVTAAAQKGDKAGTKAAVQKLRTDRRSALPAVLKDRKQLRADLRAAHDAGVTGLKETVKTAVTANQALLKEVRQAAKQARQAARALRSAPSTA